MDKAQTNPHKGPNGRWPELLREIEDQFVFVFEEQGKPNKDAKTYARLVVETLVGLLGGTTIYFPRATLQQVDEINDRIRKEFTGSNHKDLARKYGKSVIHVYRVLKKERRTE